MRSFPLILALSACSFLDPDPKLQRFEGCDDMQSYLTDMALREARHDDTFAFDGLFVFGGSAEFSAGKDSVLGLGPGGGGRAGTYSETNVQELGIDEADLVETDGKFLYALAGGSLVITVAWPVEGAALLSTVPISGTVEGMYLAGDTVVVLSTVLAWDATTTQAGVQLRERSATSTGITVVDVTERANPTVIRETWLRGDLRDSRRIGDRLFLVTHLDVGVDGWAYDDLTEVKSAVRRLDPTDWLPVQTDSLRTAEGDWQTTEGPACACRDVWWSKRESGTLFTLVTALDFNDPTSALAGEGVVGRADVVYGSSNNLYVAYSETPDGLFRSIDDQLDTVLHQFDISDAPAHPRYADTVLIPGVLPDQFALSEFDGVLRAATTNTDAYTTSVHTIEVGPDGLETLDRLNGLAPGEELYAVRFVGDIGYLVTYEVAFGQTTVYDIQFGDPLFTIDVSDPTRIREVGELVMNGWSDYIHPMDETHLLTVGMDSDDRGTWKVAVSLFDVSDLADPRLVDRELLDSASSEAQQDHHAFNYFAPFEVLAMPSQTLEGTWVLDVLHADTGEIRWEGSIEDVFEDASCGRIRRSVMLEDRVWAVSEAGMTAAAIDTPDEPILSVGFGDVGPCASAYQGYSYGYGYDYYE